MVKDYLVQYAMNTGALRTLDVGEGRFGKRESLVVKLKSIVIQYARFALLRTYVAGELRMCFGGGGTQRDILAAPPPHRFDIDIGAKGEVPHVSVFCHLPSFCSFNEWKS